MKTSFITIREKEKFVQDIINSYKNMQNDLLVQENNAANDFCWSIVEALNSLDPEERRFIVSYFFNSNDLNVKNHVIYEMNESQQKAIERFLVNLELKW